MFCKKIGKASRQCPCLIPTSVTLPYKIIRIRLHHRHFPKDVTTFFFVGGRQLFHKAALNDCMTGIYICLGSKIIIVAADLCQGDL